MLLYFDDNTDSALSYSTAWTTYVRDEGAINATSWWGGTFHSCSASSETSLAAGCNATITFTGTKVWLVGDWNPRQSRFYCALLDEDQPWRWYSGSTLASPVGGEEGLNHTRCALSGLEDKQHTLVFGQRQEDVLGNGVTLDYYVVDNATDDAVSELTWSSDFAAADSPASWRWSVEPGSSAATTSAVSSFTSASTSSTSTSSSASGSNTTAIGVGVGVGVGAAALLTLGGLLMLRRRRRARSEYGTSYAPSIMTSAGTPGPSMQPGGRSPIDGQSAFVPHSERAMSTYGNYPEPQDDSAKPYAVQSSTSPTNHTAYALSPTLESPHSFRPRT